MDNKLIIDKINNKYKNHHNFYIYTKHTEQSKRDKILYIINNKEKCNNVNNMIDKIKSVLLLKNNTYKVTCVTFKWISNEEDNSFHVIFAYSTFYNNTGKELINKKQIRLTSIKRFETKPFVQKVFVYKNVNEKITYKTVYDWLKKI